MLVADQLFIEEFIAIIAKVEKELDTRLFYNNPMKSANLKIFNGILDELKLRQFNNVMVLPAVTDTVELKGGGFVELIRVNNLPLKRVCCAPGKYEGSVTKLSFNGLYSQVIKRAFKDMYLWSHPDVYRLICVYLAHVKEIKDKYPEQRLKLKLFVNMIYELLNTRHSHLKYEIDNIHSRINYIANKALSKLAIASEHTMLVDVDCIFFHETMESLKPKIKRCHFKFVLEEYEGIQISSIKTYAPLRQGK